jgi:predicted  nucleic acid-binding Zn-ribbon protein
LIGFDPAGFLSTIKNEISQIQNRINNYDEKINTVEIETFEVQRLISVEKGVDERKQLREEKKQLRDEKKQLRDEKKQLHFEKLKLMEEGNRGTQRIISGNGNLDMFYFMFYLF